MQTEMRITMDMTLMDVMLALGEGNPGALTVIGMIVRDGEAIDPDNMLGALGFLMYLDEWGIYGSHIWLLYKDICGEDLPTMLAVMRAAQLGFITSGDIQRAVADAEGFPSAGPSFDPKDMLDKVKKRLPNFGRTDQYTP